MSRGLLAPLSPPEEIALRRIAHGSVVVDAQAAARLMSLALVERVHTSLRLTPLGRLRFNALPKAPLLARRRSVQTASDYVAGVIEKAQAVANLQAPEPATSPLVRRAPDPYRLSDSISGSQQWKSRAQIRIEKTRSIMIEHRRQQQRQCDDSRRRIAISRSLLEATMPITPAWLGGLQTDRD
jgi:hypothetical protein